MKVCSNLPKRKGKSGARLLIRKLAEASAIRGSQADSIAQKLQRHSTLTLSYAVTLTIHPSPTLTELSARD